MKKFSRLNLETLEERAVPAYYGFYGTINSSWSNLGNWYIVDRPGNLAVVPTVLPGANDYVTLLNNLTINFDVGANVNIKSLNIYAGSILNLGKVTSPNVTLEVSGDGTSQFGKGVIIRAYNDTNSNLVADLKFSGSGTASFQDFKYWGETYVNRSLAHLSSLSFGNRKDTFTGHTVLAANVTIGSGGEDTETNVWLEGANIWLSNYGSIDISTHGRLTVVEQSSITCHANNSNQLNNCGTILVSFDDAESTFTCKPTVVGGAIQVVKGKLITSIEGNGSTRVAIWSGAKIDSTGGTTTFTSGDVIDFVSDGDTTGVTLAGAFTFNGSTENFHAYTLAKPDDTNYDTWDISTATFDTTVVSYAVNVVVDDNGVSSWTGTGDTMNFDVVVGGSSTTNVNLNVAGNLVVSGSTLNVTTVGTPVVAMTVPLLTSTNPVDVVFSTFNQAPWGIWTPDAYTFGLTFTPTSGGGGGDGAGSM